MWPVERQLRDLWQLAAESNAGECGRQITRASLFNLVAVCASEEERDRASATISALTSRYPCRAMVILLAAGRAEPARPAGELTATVTAHCHLAGGGRKQVCCEQISVVAAGERIGQVPSVVLPLLESDLPTMLWWRGNFLEQPALFRRLSAVADRVMFDTSAWAAGAAALPALVAAMRAQTRGCFTDLSWTRLTLWRKLMADCFDDPLTQAALPGMRRLDVVYGCDSGARLRALLYAGWVVTQLGWSPEDAAERVAWRCREDTDATSVGLLAIELAGGTATVSIRKHFGEWTATARVLMPRACGLPRKQAFARLDEASLLAQELEHPGRHAVYERALTMAVWLASAHLDPATIDPSLFGVAALL